MGLTAICLSIAQVQPSTFKEQKSEPEQLLLLDHADPTLSYQAVYPFGPALLRSQIVVAGSRSSFDKVCWIFSGIEGGAEPPDVCRRFATVQCVAGRRGHNSAATGFWGPEPSTCSLPLWKSCRCQGRFLQT